VNARGRLGEVLVEDGEPGERDVRNDGDIVPDVNIGKLISTIIHGLSLPGPALSMQNGT